MLKSIIAAGLLSLVGVTAAQATDLDKDQLLQVEKSINHFIKQAELAQKVNGRSDELKEKELQLLKILSELKNPKWQAG
jgi:hypothetical protein